MSETPATYTWNQVDGTDSFQPLSKSRLTTFIRTRTCMQILEEPGVPPEGIALYCLSAADIRNSRYMVRPPRRGVDICSMSIRPPVMPDEVPCG